MQTAQPAFLVLTLPCQLYLPPVSGSPVLALATPGHHALTGLVLHGLPGGLADKAQLPASETQTLGSSSGLCFVTNLRKTELTRSHGHVSSSGKAPSLGTNDLDSGWLLTSPGVVFPWGQILPF